MHVCMRSCGVWKGVHAPHYAICNSHPIAPPCTPICLPSHPASGLHLGLGTQQVLEVLLQEGSVSPGAGISQDRLMVAQSVSFVQDSTQLMNSARLSQRQDGTTYSLVLTDVAPQDAGVYTCVANNAGGQVLCKAELLVHGGELAGSSRAFPGQAIGTREQPLSLHRRAVGSIYGCL